MKFLVKKHFLNDQQEYGVDDRSPIADGGRPHRGDRHEPDSEDHWHSTVVKEIRTRLPTQKRLVDPVGRATGFDAGNGSIAAQTAKVADKELNNAEKLVMDCIRLS